MLSLILKGLLGCCLRAREADLPLIAKERRAPGKL